MSEIAILLMIVLCAYFAFIATTKIEELFKKREEVDKAMLENFHIFPGHIPKKERKVEIDIEDAEFEDIT